MTEIKKPMPIGVIFKNLEDNEAFKRLSKYVEKVIETEEKLFWAMDEKDAEAQRLKVKNYKELWNKILTKIANSKKEK